MHLLFVLDFESDLQLSRLAQENNVGDQRQAGKYGILHLIFLDIGLMLPILAIDRLVFTISKFQKVHVFTAAIQSMPAFV